MRNTWRCIGAGALALALSACAAQQDDFAAATPDADGLALELAGGGAEGLAAAAGAPAARLEAVAAPAGADELGRAREALGALNGEVRRVLEQVAAAAQLPPTAELGDLRVYGPVVRCVQGDGAGGCRAQASLRLAVRRHEARLFSWRLEARPADATDPAAFRPVLAGWMARGEQAHRGRGRAAFDLDALRAVAPGYGGRGVLLAGFAHAGEARSLTYRLVGFTPDEAAREPVTAAFVGHRTPSGRTRVRVVAFEDVVAGASALPRELVLSHLGWAPGVGGRGYVVVTNWLDGAGALHGDVPYEVTGTDHYYLGRGCWGAGGELRVKEWRYCARGAGPAACLLDAPVAVEPAGATWAACTGFTGEEPLPADPAPGADQATDPEPTPPGDAPPAPEAPPADASDTAPPALG